MPQPPNLVTLSREYARLPEESVQAYTRFLEWLADGAPNRSKGSLPAIAKTYRWKERLAENGFALAPHASQVSLASLVETRPGDPASKALYDLAKATIAKLLLADQLSEDPVASLRELASILPALHNYERLEADRSTENIAVAGSPTSLDEEALSQLSADELKLLKKVLPKLLGD